MPLNQKNFSCTGDKEVDEFMKKAIRLPKNEFGERIKSTTFSTLQLISILESTYHGARRELLERAVEVAVSSADWIALVKFPEVARKALNEIPKFNLETPEVIELLLKSGSQRLRCIGWYLAKKQNLPIEENPFLGILL